MASGTQILLNLCCLGQPNFSSPTLHNILDLQVNVIVIPRYNETVFKTKTQVIINIFVDNADLARNALDLVCNIEV